MMRGHYTSKWWVSNVQGKHDECVFFLILSMHYVSGGGIVIRGGNVGHQFEGLPICFAEMQHLHWYTHVPVML